MRSTPPDPDGPDRPVERQVPYRAPAGAGHRLLYVAGYGRSGSTLLDIALSSHRDITGLGELAYLFHELDRCPHGPDSLWTDLPVGPEGHRAAARLVDRAERLDGGPALVIRPERRRRYRRLQRAVLDHAHRRTGASVLIDSSKSSWLRTWRLPLLRGTVDEVHCVVLVRDLRGVVHSVRSGRGDTLAAQRRPTTRAVIGWALATVTAVAVGLATCGRDRTRIVRFEDLAERPGPTLDGLVARLGLDPDPAIDRGVADGFRPGRQLRGNRVKAQFRVHIDRRAASAPTPQGVAGVAVRVVSSAVEWAALRWVPSLDPSDRPATSAHRIVNSARIRSAE